jgi:dipeptidyl aminopeptidase/acylaminoacyl peptidase
MDSHQQIQAPPTRTLRQRLTFVLRTVAVITVILLLLAPFGAGFGFIAFLTRPGCASPPNANANPADWNMPFQDVSFTLSELNLPTPAYFIPAENPNGGTIIVVPTGPERRGDRIHEIAVYHRNGYHVLSFEARSCIANVPTSLGYREVPQVGDALAYLATRSDVETERIAIHGFSAGGALSVMAGARYPELRAVVAEGGYHDFTAELNNNTTYMGIMGGLFRTGAHLAYRVNTGDDLSVLSPISVIAQIAPRPILLVYGTNEPSLYGARLQQTAAGDNANLWEVPGATHGSYLADAPEDYERIVIGFMDEAMGIER